MTQTIINLGTGGAALNAQNGSTGSADSNDALFLAWTGENYVYQPGFANNYMEVPDAADLDIVGDIDLRFYGAADDWSPAGVNPGLVSKRGLAGQVSYQLTGRAGGGLGFNWSEDGTAVKSKNSTISTPFADGQAGWVRVTLDVDNGAGGNDVRFFTSVDGVSWTQLGATGTTAGVTSIFNSTAAVDIGRFSSSVFAGKIYRAQIFNGIDGTKVLDVDTSVITTGSATSFTALTGQTVTINRNTAGRKSVAVVSPVWLFGTDDYMEVADNDLLDFGASDSFTVLAVVRQWATVLNTARLVNKAAGTDTGWSIVNGNSVEFAISSRIDDGPNVASRIDLSPSSAGAVSLKGMLVDRTAQTLQSFNNATLSATTSTSSVGSLANALPMRVGRDSTGTSYNDMELIAVAVFRRALTAGEIATISSYYQGRLS